MAVLVALAGTGFAASPSAHPEVPVTATFLTNQRSQNSPTLAVHPEEPRFVALASRIDGPTEFGCALHVSGDGGQGWLPAQPVTALPPGVEHCYAPEIAFDRSGRLYYLFVGLAGAGNSPVGAYLTSSTDYGRTFSEPIMVLGPRKYGVRMAIDPETGPQGRMHLVWLAPSAEPSLGSLPLSPNPILTAHSDDGGRTFSEPIQVSDPSRRLVVAPALALGPDHTVHVAYYDLGDDRRDYQGLEGPTWEGEWSLVTATSDDGGLHFAEGAVVADDIAPPERVMLIFTMPPPVLVAGAEGEVYVSWWEARHGDWDVFVAHSERGTSWGAPVRVNDDPVGNGRHQYMPRLAVAPGGRLDVIFYDRRDDRENVRNHVYYASSKPGGRGFAPNHRITSESFFSDTGSRYPLRSAEGLVEFGSRIALASRRSGVLAAWTDTRLTPRGLEHQDIFAAAVELPATSAGSGSFILMGGVGLVLSAIALGVARTMRHRKRALRS